MSHKKAAHHGGSWKVAYADLMTSMFALIMLLWIVGADEETRRAVEDYFQGRKTNIQPGERGLMDMQRDEHFRTKPQDSASQNMVSINEFQQAVEQVRNQLNNSSEVGEDQIRFEYTADGVRITAIDRAKHPFFDPNTSNLTPFGQFVMQNIGSLIERMPVQVEVEGHTEKSSDGTNGLSSWDLSTQRALSSEQALAENGVKGSQFFRVAGKGDSDPIDPANPQSEDNRRIAIVLRPAPGEDANSFRSKMSSLDDGSVQTAPSTTSSSVPPPAPAPAPNPTPSTPPSP